MRNLLWLLLFHIGSAGETGRAERGIDAEPEPHSGTRYQDSHCPTSFPAEPIWNNNKPQQIRITLDDKSRQGE